MKKIDFEMASWIDSCSDYDVFATVTFKQAIVVDDKFVRATRGDIEKTCAIIMDRMFRKCRAKMPWITTIECGGGAKRIHAHVAVRLPDHITFDEFSTVFIRTSSTLDWVYDEIDVRHIDWLDDEEDGGAGKRKVIFYMFKEGVDALALSASHLGV